MILLQRSHSTLVDCSSDQAIVLRVGPDPEPKHAVLHFDGERTVVETDA